eukprot:g3190.t1
MASKKDLVKMERALKQGHGVFPVNCVTSTKIYIITGGYHMLCLDTTPCEKYVVTGSCDKSLILWKLSNGNRERSFVGHTGWVWAVAVTPSGDGIVSGSEDRTAILWNIHDSSRLLTFKGHEDCVYGVVVSSSGLHLYTCSADKTAIKWSMKTGERLDTFRGHGECVHSCCLTSDDKHLLTASDDKTVIVWNADDTTRLHTLKGHSSSVWSISMSTGQLIALLWVLSYLILRGYFLSMENAETVVGGYPRWRNYLGTCFQLVQLPAICAFAWWHGTGGNVSFRRWGNRWRTKKIKGRAASAEDAEGLHCTEAFSLIFPLFIILDWVLIGVRVVPPLISAHHIVCLVGHLMVVKGGPPDVFPYYLLGVSALEVGGGFTNLLDLLTPEPSVERAQLGKITVMVMSVSNLLGLWCAFKFLQFKTRARVGLLLKIVLAVLILGLTFLRQTQTMEQAHVQHDEL